MGTFGEGLLDDDASRDRLHFILNTDVESTKVEDVVAKFGIQLLVSLEDKESFLDFVDTQDTDGLGEDVLTRIEEYRSDSLSLSNSLTQSQLNIFAAAGLNGGPFVREFVFIKGNNRLLDRVIESCEEALDLLVEDMDLYEAAEYLGVIGFLAVVKAVIKEIEISDFRDLKETAIRIDRNTDDEREFWDLYSKNLHVCLECLKSSVD